MHSPSPLEDYFSPFRNNIIGYQQHFESPFGRQRIVYADWTASGRAYHPVEAEIMTGILPFFANTHTHANTTGTMMSNAYERARRTIRDHVGAAEDDVLVFCGSGMTAAVNRLQRILGLRLPERAMDYGTWLPRDEETRPLVLVTHMEHHSNHISWLETIATVEIIRPCSDGNVDLGHLRELLQRYSHRKHKIAAVTACSNVTGIETPYHSIASIVHEYEGFCFVDFACSAPYVRMNMHPGDRNSDLDAIYFSCHKFLGGPGTPGVLVFNSRLYKNRIPDQPGGGTLLYSNPWNGREYIPDIQEREDGGTPPLLQAIKAGMCIRLKEEMGIENILKREEELLSIVFDRLSKMVGVRVLAPCNRERLGIVSFIVKDLHHDLAVKILNDRFGIQVRGGCSCAGTYGHFLLGIDRDRSNAILDRLREGDMQAKPGWVRLSIHPVMTGTEICYIMDAIEAMIASCREWAEGYVYDRGRGQFIIRT